MRNELKYNSSGYYDDTAYKAMKKLSKEENLMNVKKGDIWLVEKTNGTDGEILVLNAFESYVSGIMLHETPTPENSIEVKSRALVYGDAGRIGYAYYSNLRELVRELTEDEMRNVEIAIINTLELPTLVKQPEYAPTVEAPQKRRIMSDIGRLLLNTICLPLEELSKKKIGLWDFKDEEGIHYIFDGKSYLITVEDEE